MDRDGRLDQPAGDRLVTELPPIITDPKRFREGYIYVPRWEEFQHRDALRSGPPMKWIKVYADLLYNDAYLDLAPSWRGLLHDLWLLTGRMGQGRCSARADLLQTLCYGAADVPPGLVQRGLKALSHAGFIEVRAGKAPAFRQQPASTEESREEVGGEASTTSSIVGPKTARARALGSAAPAALAPSTPSPNGDKPHNLDAELEHDRDWTISRIAKGLWTRSRFGDVDDTLWHDLEQEAATWRDEHGVELLAASLEPEPDTDEEPI